MGSIGNLRQVIPDWDGGRQSRIGQLAEAGRGRESSRTVDTSTENGVTTYTITTRVARTSANANLHVGRFSVGASYSEGTEVTYQVSMPEAEASPEAAMAINPFEPETIPVGTTVTMDSTQFQDSELETSFHVFANKSGISVEEGVRLVITRVDADTVRVFTGPISALESNEFAGLDVGVASVGLLSSHNIREATLQSAEFDISDPDGRSAFDDFVDGGELPEAEGDGVSNIQTITKFDSDFDNGIGGSIGPVDFEFGGDSSEISHVTVTNADGSGTAMVYHRGTDGAPEVTVSQSFDSEGNEIIAERRYEFSFTVPDQDAAIYLNNAMAGRRDGPYQAGDQVTLTFTEAEMAQILETATARSPREVETEQYPADLVDLTHTDGVPYGEVVTPWEFAANLVAGKATVYDFLGSLSAISYHAGEIGYPGTTDAGFVQLPGTATIEAGGDAAPTQVVANVVDEASGESNDVTWTLDAEGRPIQAEGTLTWEPGSGGRDADAAENTAQSQFRDEHIAPGSGDHVGHVIAYRFVNGQGMVNMFPQNGNFNTSAYKRLENEWADWLAEGMEVEVEVQLLPAGAERPDQVQVDYRVIDPQTGAVVYDPVATVFDNEAGQVFDRVARSDMDDMIAEAS